MTGLADISLLRPFWLLSIPCLIVFAIQLKRKQTTVGNWTNVIDPGLMSAMRSLGQITESASGSKRQLPLWAAGLIAIALAGPALERRDAQAFRNLDGVVFVVDVSKSVIEDPLWPALLTMGRIGVASLGSKPGAMIVYAGDAYLASALTQDTHQIGLTMTLLDSQTVPDAGTRPALALDRAANIVKDAEIIAGDVILLSDGGGLGPEALIAAKEIASQGGRLSVIFAPTRSAANNLSAVETLVAVGGGTIYPLEDSDALSRDLSATATDRMERQDYLLLFWADYGRYVLILALVPLLAQFRRGAS